MEKMNLDVFRERFEEMVSWSDCGNIDEFCKKYNYSSARLSSLFYKGMVVLDFLYTIAKDNEIELSWLLGVTDS